MTVRLALVRSEAGVEPRLRIAFATADRRHVDQHFGSAESFAMYDVGVDGHAFVAVVRFPAAAHDGNEDKLGDRVDALAGCAAVYVQAVGSSAIQRLIGAGVQPVKVMPGTPIAAVLKLLKPEIAAAAAPWIARALRMVKDPSRFEAMGAEDWDE